MIRGKEKRKNGRIRRQYIHMLDEDILRKIDESRTVRVKLEIEIVNN